MTTEEELINNLSNSLTTYMKLCREERDKAANNYNAFGRICLDFYDILENKDLDDAKKLEQLRNRLEMSATFSKMSKEDIDSMRKMLGGA